MLIYKLPPRKTQTITTKKASSSTVQRGGAVAAASDENKPSDFSNVVSIGKLPFLKHQRCLNMTLEQYKNKEHINKKMCYIEFDSTLYDIENNIINNLEVIRSKIREPFKKDNKTLIPLPIYVSIAKIISRDNKYVLNNTLSEDTKKFPETFFEKYTFKGNMKIIIYVPNLMNNKDQYYNYYPSLDAYTNQNKWMEYMTSPDSYYLKVIDNRTKANLNYRYDNLFKKSLNNICGDFGCVSGNVGEDIDHIRGKYGGAIYMPTKCLQSKEYSSQYNMNRDFNDLYSKSSDEAKKIYEENLKEAKKEAESDNDEKLEEEEEDELMKNSVSETLGYMGREGKDGNKINRSYNNTIINDINRRADSNFPGIPEITFRMLKLNENYSKFSGFFHYMPWGDKLLNSEYVLNSGATFFFEDSKYVSKNKTTQQYIKFKSINDKYYMEFNSNGILAIYNNNGTQKTVVPYASRMSLMNTKNKRIHYDPSLGIHFLGEYIDSKNGNSEETLSIKYNTDNRSEPYSLILDTDENNIGRFKIYDLGFNVIFNN